MKKFMAVVLVCICVWGIVGCNQQPQQVQGKQLLVDGNVIKIDVSSHPEGYNYSFDGENAKAIIDYLSNLNLDSNFEENPDEYVGMAWVISIKYESGGTVTLCHSANKFIRTANGPWYKMTYEEASRFDALLNELGD